MKNTDKIMILSYFYITARKTFHGYDMVETELHHKYNIYSWQKNIRFGSCHLAFHKLRFIKLIKKNRR